MEQSRQPEFVFRLDAHSGVPVYRQLIDQVQAAVATKLLKTGDQLPTVRRVAVDLEINPNTVARAYREMELRGILDTQHGTGTFVADHPGERSPEERQRVLNQFLTDLMARIASAGLRVSDVQQALDRLSAEPPNS